MNTTPHDTTRPPTRGRVSRTEIADHVEGLFDGNQVHRSDLYREAERTSARPALLDVLAALPDRAYRRLGDLWQDLPHLPIDDDPR